MKEFSGHKFLLNLVILPNAMARGLPPDKSFNQGIISKTRIFECYKKQWKGSRFNFYFFEIHEWIERVAGF
jgi:hypothetical protein